MKQLGIKQENIDAERVVIEKSDGSKIVIETPSVVKINMQGNDSFQISGNIKEEKEKYSEEDIKQVIEKTGKSKEEAETALTNSKGDLAEAILSLS